MSENSLNLYVEEVYTEEDKTVILLETSNETQNLIIEEEVKKVIFIDGQPPNRSFLKLIIPSDNYNLELQAEKWYSFQLEFFSNVEEYNFTNEDDIGSNLIRAIISFEEKTKSKPKIIRNITNISCKHFNLSETYNKLVKKRNDIVQCLLKLIFSDSDTLISNYHIKRALIEPDNAIEYLQNKREGIEDECQEIKKIEKIIDKLKNKVKVRANLDSFVFVYRLTR